MMNGVQNVSFGGKPRVVPAGEHNVVITSKGEDLNLHGQMSGSTTKVQVLRDGTYKITSRPSVYGAKPVVKILTEEELVAQYGKEAGKNLQVVA